MTPTEKFGQFQTYFLVFVLALLAVGLFYKSM